MSWSKTAARKRAELTVRDAASLLKRQKFARYWNLSESGFWRVQQELLSATYEDAVRHVAYYRDRRLYPEALPGTHPVEALSVLPLLPKEAVRSAPESFERHPASPLVRSHTTGGTSGTPMRIRASVGTRLQTSALLDSTYELFCGVRRPKILNLSGYLTEDELWMERVKGREAFLSIYNLTPMHAPKITAHLEAFRPEIIYGYASALVQLAHLLADVRISVPNLRCVSTSETLDPRQREVIEAGLGAIVHNQYGSQEGQHMAFECEHRGLHIHPARGVVEILKFESDMKAAPGDLGRVVVTGLQNRDMPLIRYEIGDSAVSTGYATTCECGMKWPTIGAVQGRMEDLVRTSDGRRIGLLSHASLKDLEGIVESQLIQINYTDFVYRLTVDDGFEGAAAERHIRSELTRRIGSPVAVEFKYVDSIERTPSGKVKAVVVNF